MKSWSIHPTLTYVENAEASRTIGEREPNAWDRDRTRRAKRAAAFSGMKQLERPPAIVDLADPITEIRRKIFLEFLF
jgi:hypothetical protein